MSSCVCAHPVLVCLHRYLVDHDALLVQLLYPVQSLFFAGQPEHHDIVEVEITDFALDRHSNLSGFSTPRITQDLHRLVAAVGCEDVQFLLLRAHYHKHLVVFHSFLQQEPTSNPDSLFALQVADRRAVLLSVHVQREELFAIFERECCVVQTTHHVSIYQPLPQRFSCCSASAIATLYKPINEVGSFETVFVPGHTLHLVLHLDALGQLFTQQQKKPIVLRCS
mmetsp:Transcript_17696/g.24867  ORF Transcript_17696/g.24867 Transcript_17696/m.24867 type:complete len:224 (-) Transcript_17696:796-1467(-)